MRELVNLTASEARSAVDGTIVWDHDDPDGRFKSGDPIGYREFARRKVGAPPVKDARTRIAIWMIARGYATGHGDTIEDLLVELEGQAKRRKHQDGETTDRTAPEA